LKVKVISVLSSTIRILLYTVGAVKSNSEIACLGLFPILPVVVSCNCGGGDDDGNVCLFFSIFLKYEMGDIQLTYRYHDIQL
jgi:hypothetical protein